MKYFEQRTDDLLYFMNRIWVPLFGDLRQLVLDEAHTSRYSVHPGSDKMYQDLKTLYWWPNVKAEVATYVNNCLTCAKVKVEYRKLSGTPQQPEVPMGANLHEFHH